MDYIFIIFGTAMETLFNVSINQAYFIFADVLLGTVSFVSKHVS